MERRETGYLEAVCQGNLNKLNAILDEIRKVSLDLGMKPSRTVYKGWGKAKSRILQFSKSGNPHMENTYSTHYIMKKDKNPTQGNIPPQGIIPTRGNIKAKKADIERSENRAPDLKETDGRKPKDKVKQGEKQKVRRKNKKTRKSYYEEDNSTEEFGWFYGEYHGSDEEDSGKSSSVSEGDIPF